MHEAPVQAAEMILEERNSGLNLDKNDISHRIQLTKPAVLNPVEDYSHYKTSSVFLNSEDPRDAYVIENKYDVIPEIMNGKNICDFYGENHPDLNSIEIPAIKIYDTLTLEQKMHKEDINNARMAANMKSIFNKRKSISIKGFL